MGVYFYFCPWLFYVVVADCGLYTSHVLIGMEKYQSLHFVTHLRNEPQIAVVPVNLCEQRGVSHSPDANKDHGVFLPHVLLCTSVVLVLGPFLFQVCLLQTFHPFRSMGIGLGVVCLVLLNISTFQ